MAIIHPGKMGESAASAARTGVTSADADYNHAVDDAVDGGGWQRVLVMAVKTSGGDANSTITIQPVVRMGEAWAKLPALAALKTEEAAAIDVYGRKVFLHVTALTAGTTWTIQVGGAEAMRPDCGAEG